MEKPKIGLVLGSGGARGWAHVGVLRRLTELGIEPCCVVGTSIGALVGAVYCAGNLATLEDLESNLDWQRVARLFLELQMPRSGLLGGRNVVKLLKDRDMIGLHDFASFERRLAVVATDLHAERPVVLSSGNPVDAVRASIAIPGVFTPQRLDGVLLVDGGMTNPLPIDVCRAMGADVVIAVDINLRKGVEKPVPERRLRLPPDQVARVFEVLSRHVPQVRENMESLLARWFGDDPERGATSEPSIFDVLTRSIRLMENEITRHILEKHPPDILIQPAVGHVLTMEFHRGGEVIRAGRDAVDEQEAALTALAQEVNRGS